MKLSRDLGFGFRLLRKRPGFTVAGGSRSLSGSAPPPPFSAPSMRFCCGPCLVEGDEEN